jgi:uncharacterized protein YceH (UPF0502 family)
VTSHRLSAIELRVLGSLMEKERTTPDQYPLSLNALRLACNQQTSREPVMTLSEDEVRDAVRSLANAGWARLASGTGSRVAKYRHDFDDSLDLLPSESSILAVLFLRGPQTVNELRTRTERAHHFAGNDDVVSTLERLAEKDLVREIGRAPGQRETRWMHLLASDAPEVVSETVTEVAAARRPESNVESRLARLEDRVNELERALAERRVGPELVAPDHGADQQQEDDY